MVEKMKNLFLCNFRFSAMTPEEKSTAMSLWKYKWDMFVDDIIINYRSGLCGNHNLKDICG